jgi:CHASE3 domain sensor protein
MTPAIEAMDDEQRLIERREIKRRRLHELDKQADFYGERDVPPHIEMERVQLRYELGVVETAISSPARVQIGDELGAAGRFMSNMEQNRQILSSIGLVARRLDEFISESLAWRTMHRTLIVILIVVVVFILVVVVAIVTWLAATHGGV